MIRTNGPRAAHVVKGERVGPLEMTAVSGEHIDVPTDGRLIHLQFRRFAGCPICDLHLRTFVRRQAEIERAGILEVILFHSDEAELRAYAGELSFLLVADPDKQFYAQFGVEAASRALRDARAWPYVLLGVLRSLARVIGGRQRLPPISPQGGSLGLPADFLLAPDGTVLASKYGEHAYDQWSVEALLDIADAAVREAELSYGAERKRRAQEGHPL